MVGMDHWDVIRKIPSKVHIKDPQPMSTQFVISSPTKPWFLGLLNRLVVFTFKKGLHTFMPPMDVFSFGWVEATNHQWWSGD